MKMQVLFVLIDLALVLAYAVAFVLFHLRQGFTIALRNALKR